LAPVGTPPRSDLERSRAGPQTLWLHPRSGASWEGFALEQVLQVAQQDEAYFWATHAGAELDLLMFKRG